MINILFDYGRERNNYSASEYGDVAISTGPNARDADNAIPHSGSGASGKSEVTHVNSTHVDLSGNFASIANTSVGSSRFTAYHSSMNENDVSDGKTLLAGGVSENGVSSYVAVDLHICQGGGVCNMSRGIGKKE
ncbi:hypothetical protein L1987_59929 [Smallanthus sonchifolius]|uniref:Uncharacterized protein n=1 Tax=Smallanthus sonchifolius TaxID=185202 RepID=A0ACB9D6N1_9ASTR|nr:hypothetical protein L1987_59929 [Smallanthus sonchifolius]